MAKLMVKTRAIYLVYVDWVAITLMFTRSNFDPYTELSQI